MSLSQWDLKYLSPDEQAEVLSYKQQWAGADATTRTSLNNAANTIRQKYGYDGGVDGGQYTQFETYQPPTIPTIPGYESQYGDAMSEVMEQIKNPPKYQSPYEDLINQSISDLVNRPSFSYDPESDTAYQAYRQRALAAGDKAFEDNLGGMSAMTGGRPNSWAGTVASQARNAYVLDSEMAVIQFEDRAYSRYQGETQDMYNLVNLLNTQDQTAYNRFRDTIGDTKDYADMIMRLDERDFTQYQQMVQNTWNTFSAETEQYQGALNFKKDQIATAIDRTNLNGYVNNQDSVVLGVAAGTLSQAARERAEAMEDYIRKSEIDFENFKKEKEVSHNFDLKLLAAQQSYINARSSGGGGGGGGSSSDGGNSNFIPNDTETNRVNSESKKFTDLVNSDEFKRMTREQKFNAIGSLREEVVASAKSNLYGKNSMSIANLILDKIQTSSAYKQYYINYKPAGEIKQQIKQDTKPGGLLDALKRK